MITKPKLYLMIDNSDEVEIADCFDFIKFDGIDIDTPSMSNNYQDISYFDGNNFNYSTFNKNIVNVKLDMQFTTYYDYKAKRQMLYDYFMQKKIYRVRTDAEPMFVYFLRPVSFEIKPYSDGANNCFITIPFENPSGYKYSRYDSLNQLDLWDDYPLGWDLPIVTKEDFMVKNQSSLSLFNPSGVSIDPYIERHSLIITLKWKGSFIRLFNETNGSSFEINMDNDGTKEITLNKLDFFYGDSQINDKTDFGNLKLEKGINNIKVSGSDNFEVKFEFPFIYV